MTLPAKQAVLSAALGVALSFAPAVAAAEPTPADLDKIARQLDDLRREVDGLKKSQEETEAAFYGMRDRDGRPGSEGVYTRLKSLEEKFDRIQRSLDEITLKLAETPRTAASSPLGGTADGLPRPMTPPAAGASAKGTVRVVNEYATEISLLLNGRAYRLNAGETRSIDVPSGEYTYELLQSGAQPVTSRVKDGETVTLRVH